MKSVKSFIVRFMPQLVTFGFAVGIATLSGPKTNPWG